MLCETVLLYVFTSESACISLILDSVLILFRDLTLEMKRGHISLMPFSFIEQLLVRGDVELL